MSVSRPCAPRVAYSGERVASLHGHGNACPHVARPRIDEPSGGVVEPSVQDQKAKCEHEDGSDSTEEAENDHGDLACGSARRTFPSMPPFNIE